MSNLSKTRPGRRFDWLAGAIFLGPGLAALAVVALVPAGYAIFGSFFDWHFLRPEAREFIGFGNYAELATDGRFLRSLGVTGLYTVTSVLATIVLGFLLALLVKHPFPGKNVARALLTIPMIMTPVVSTLVFKTFFFEADLGLVNWVLEAFGVDGPAWIARSPSALISILIVNIWFMTPFVFLILDASLSSFPEEVIDASRIDGASYWQRVGYVILPMLRGALIFTLVFRITIDFRMFDIIQVMTGGGPARDTEVLSLWVYSTALRNFQVGYGNAGAVVMMVAVAIVCLAILLLGTRGGAGRLGSK